MGGKDGAGEGALSTMWAPYVVYEATGTKFVD
jgi:hypothetical protein